MEGASARGQPAAAFAARRPAVVAAVLFILGILLHSLLPHKPILWLPMTAALLAGAALMLNSPRLSSLCLALAMLMSGACLAQIEAFYYPDDHISGYAEDEPRLAQLELYIDNVPRTLTTPFGQYRVLAPRQIVTGRVVRVLTWDGWVPASGDILVSVNQPHPELAIGQTVRALGMLQRPAPAMNPGQFDWERYYREQRILNSIRISQPENIQILSRRQFMPLAWLREKVRRTLAMGFSPAQSLDHALLRAILVGDRDPEMRDVQEQFRRTGTSHHLAISGLHVGILTGFVYMFCRIVRLGPRATAWALVCFVTFYGLVALPAAPVVRSVLLCGAIALGMLWGRSRDPVQLLAVAVLLMLVYHPLDLYNPGFQLSFVVVLGLICFTRRVAELIRASAPLDPQVRPPRLSERLARWSGSRARDALAGGMVAWAVSVPLVALHFERLNPWAIPGSLLLAPIVFVALGAGLAKTIFTLVLPSLAEAWATMAAAPVQFMRLTVEWLERLPLADVPAGGPSLYVVAGFYLVLLLPVLPWRWPRIARLMRVGPVAACLVALCVPVLGGMAPRSSSGQLQVTLLAVGAGQCAVVRLPDGRTILFDAGSTSLADLVRNCAGPYLRHVGVRHVHAIYLSHPHYDHFSGVPDLIALANVQEIAAGHFFRANSVGNPAAEALLRALQQAERPLRTLTMGETVHLGPHTFLEVLWPGGERWFDADNASLVLRLTHAGRSVIFPGDIQEHALRGLLGSGIDLQADVLIGPHHGSSEISTAAFVAAVDPHVILCSNARRMTMKQRDFDAITAGRAVYRTSRSGAITVTIHDSGQIDVQPFVVRPEPGGMIIPADQKVASNFPISPATPR